MREDQFYIVLPSNSSTRHFPHNKTSSFTTQLPQTLSLHGEWEVGLSEIQFPNTFLHINHGENTLKFVDIDSKDKDKTDIKLTSTEAVIPNGIYKDINELYSTINSACKKAGSHFHFEARTEEGFKTFISLTCANKCGKNHYLNVSDNLLKIIGCGHMLLFKKGNFYTELTALKPNSTKDFYTAKFLIINKPDLAFWGKEPHSLIRGIPDKMFVYCDICEPYITGDVKSPLLRIVPIPLNAFNYTYGANQTSYFSPSHYIPLRKTNFRTIEIDIKDALGKSIPFQSGTLTVTLHFRRYQ